ncbi:MAG: beta-ketoacyl synthase chain length factor [Bacteroidales bacterium]|nr:beta-ketoacyl synthase chain length factor [Bacteroidales bacterium]
MPIYINGLSSITPQNTFENNAFLDQIIDHNQLFLEIQKPEYKNFINPKLLRRMSKIIRMGVTTGMAALKEAGVENPDAIITGTGLGCIEDTEKFLNALLENNEQLLTPTSFILSTHNTVSAQIAVMLGCNNYNYTYVHSAVSFENSLVDAIMHFQEGQMHNILVGGIDEITQENYDTKVYSGIWKKEASSILNLFDYQTQGCIPGESATFAVLSNIENNNSYGQLIDVHTFFEGDLSIVETELETFLKIQNIALKDIDVLLAGINGDAHYDQMYYDLHESKLSHTALVSFKNVCGENDSSSAFAFWVAAKIAKHQNIPEFISIKDSNKTSFRYILIYHYNFIHRNNHAFSLIRALF